MVRADATDWDAYYDVTTPTAHLTRAYTLGWIQRQLAAEARSLGRDIEVIEFGGGNSCFAAGLLKAMPISRYHVVDSNEKSLQLFRDRLNCVTSAQLSTTQADLLSTTPEIANADVVFSVGLIEHFDPAATGIVAARHFDVARPDGLVIMTAPTPTWLYQAVRGAAERLGQWNFPDERPIKKPEMLGLGNGRGALLHSEILWPLILTQYGAAWRVNSGRVQ